MRSSSLNGRVKKVGLDPSTKLQRPVTLDEILSHVSSRTTTTCASGIVSALKRKDYGYLVGSSIDPSEYSDAVTFAQDYLLTSIVKKCSSFDLGIDRSQLAFEKWLDAEESCRKSNHFFRSLSEGETPFPPRVMSLLFRAQRKVREILRDIDFDFIRENCRFGPGSDLTTDGDFTSSYNKYKSSGSSTPWVQPLYSEIFSEDFREDFLHDCSFVQGNRLSFVPKNAKIDRAICVEPRWNIYLQLGIGELIVKRLKAAGLDITIQDRNRDLASRAFVDGLATIDLSSASDTVSKGLVLFLLPDDWADLIFKSRSPISFFKDKRYPLEKVSSMGNGYTFPLESLIFYALATSVTEAEVGVFGDDIIVPQDCAADLIELLTYSGFSVNTEKSFISGQFFESCGADYFQGRNVRPFFIKKAPRTILDHYILSNQIVEYSQQLPELVGPLDLLALWNLVVSRIPKAARLYGPIGMAGVIHASFDACCPSPSSDGWDGWMITVWAPSPVKVIGNHYFGHLYSKLHGGTLTRQCFTTRSRIKWKKKVTYLPRYGDFTWSNFS